MSMSPDELRKLFNEWKTEGRILRMLLLQNGQTTLWTRPTAWEVTDNEVRLSFGFPKLASGDVVISLSDLLVIKFIENPAASFPQDHSASDYEACVEFSWTLLSKDRERCIVCVQRRV